MTMLPADHRADLQKLEKIAGEPASLETEEEFESLFPNCAKGAMRPFGNLYGLPTCVDKRLTQEDYIVFEAGTHTDAIKLNDRGYEQIVKPRVGRPGDQGASHPASLIIAGQKDRDAMRVWTAAIPSTDSLFQLPASRTRGPGALGKRGGSGRWLFCRSFFRWLCALVRCRSRRKVRLGSQSAPDWCQRLLKVGVPRQFRRLGDRERGNYRDERRRVLRSVFRSERCRVKGF